MDTRKIICGRNKPVGMLNSILRIKSIINKSKALVYGYITESIMLYGTQTWTLNNKKQ